MRIRHCCLLTLAAAAGLAGGAAAAAPDCRVAPRLTPIEQRVADAAGRGVDELRRYVQSVQRIHQFHLHETMEAGMRNREWQLACGRASAVADSGTAPEQTKPTR